MKVADGWGNAENMMERLENGTSAGTDTGKVTSTDMGV
jgi:hypothetical protein